MEVIAPQRLFVPRTGFRAFNPLRNLKAEYDITVVGPRNHFRFAQLLASTIV
jgi:hypothetical protein